MMLEAYGEQVIYLHVHIAQIVIMKLQDQQERVFSLRQQELGQFQKKDLKNYQMIIEYSGE